MAMAHRLPSRDVQVQVGCHRPARNGCSYLPAKAQPGPDSLPTLARTARVQKASASNPPLPPLLRLRRKKPRSVSSSRRRTLRSKFMLTCTFLMTRNNEGRLPLWVTHWTSLYGQRGKESYHEYKTLKKLYNTILARVVRLPPEERDDFDFAVFNNFAGISDEPITQYFPYILRAYPNAQVILTTRNSTDWVQSRQKHHPMSPMPLAFLTRSIDAIYKLTVLVRGFFGRALATAIIPGERVGAGGVRSSSG